jgi:hypothetical protein
MWQRTFYQNEIVIALHIQHQNVAILNSKYW